MQVVCVFILPVGLLLITERSLSKGGPVYKVLFMGFTPKLFWSIDHDLQKNLRPILIQH